MRSSTTTVEVFHSGKRVAPHLRCRALGRHSTDQAHMPDSHRHAEWSPDRIIEWTAKTGPATTSLRETLMEARRHPEQGYRSCLGIIRLADRYGADRLKASAARALGAVSYRSVESILSPGLDSQPLPDKPTARAHRRHSNLRGPEYYR